ncbi:ArgE/DapE family deacylase [Candidatus Bathyarchaeota archaeon]|nr:ArgE/DapE family deacylase [Candidatus Bathyarchaeota archaeon]
MNNNPIKQKLIKRAEADREHLIDFLRGFLRKPSPNPPGDTREAARYITNYLEERNTPYKVVGPDPEKPNIISSFGKKRDHRRLILNGHMDVFPVKSRDGWSYPPWGGEMEKGKIYGRGACDMKAGTVSLIYTYLTLREQTNELEGGATLIIVSDEETGGRLGSGWVLDNIPEAMGDCCISAEPSSPGTIRFGEKGILWLKISVTSKGGHGAYPHLSENPVKIASKIITDLESLGELEADYPENLLAALQEGKNAAEKALGNGGAEVMRRLTVNIGKIEGGVKVNVIPRECSFEVDLRIPPGLSREQILPEVEEILKRYPSVSLEETRYDGPLWSLPDSEMALMLRKNSQLMGIDPLPIVSLGGSDLKFWRKKGVPSYYYGPTNHGMGTTDEYVEVEEYMHVTKVHLLSAYDYLRKK